MANETMIGLDIPLASLRRSMAATRLKYRPSPKQMCDAAISSGRPAGASAYEAAACRLLTLPPNRVASPIDVSG